MFTFLRKFIGWLLVKALFCLFLVASLTSLGALWIYVHDDRDADASRVWTLARLQAERADAAAVQADLAARLAVCRQQVTALELRAARAGAISESLESTMSWWRRWISDREQQRRNEHRLEALWTIRDDAASEARRLSLDVELIGRTLAGREKEMGRLDGQLRMRKNTTSVVAHYLDLSWWRVRWYVAAGVLLYLVGPTLRKLVLFYLVAPQVAKGRAVRLASEVTAYPWLGESKPQVETVLWPGESARVRRRYLGEVDDGVGRQRSIFLSWRFPFTSLLTGFLNPVGLRNARAGRQYRVAFADRRNAANELAVVHVPAGGSIIVRPSYVVAVVYSAEDPYQLTRRWQLFRWQSWVTGQFRYFEFSGPCRLIVAGRRGLRGERLASQATGGEPVLRTSQDRTIGFTPNLDYRLIRTMRFWNYLRREKTLYDAYFVGIGFVLIHSRQQSGRPRGFLAHAWFVARDRTLKLLGL